MPGVSYVFQSMKREAIVAVAGLLMSGCLESTWAFHGDVTFTPEERASIEAANVWIAERTGENPVPIVWDRAHEDENCADSSTILRRPALTGGLEDHRTWCIYLGIAPGAADLEIIAAHEFGHWHGLKHIAPDVRGIMNPTAMIFEWTDADQERCREDGLCK